MEEGDIIHTDGHDFKVIKKTYSYPNGICIPYYIDIKLERLPEENSKSI